MQFSSHLAACLFLGTTCSSMLVSALEPASPVMAINFEDAADPHVRTLTMNPLLVLAPGRGVGGGTALRTTYEPTETGTRVMVVRVALPPALEYSLNYDVNFEKDFQFVRGGKLHGFGPKRPVSGGDPIRPDGWSARVTFSRNNKITSYTYHQNQPGRYGDAGHVDDPNFTAQNGRWYAVSLHVRVNELPESRGGFVRMYVDGTRIQSFEQVQLRGIGGEDTLITNFHFSTFHGGSTSAWTPRDEQGNPVTVHALFDNFEVHPGEHIKQSIAK